MSERGRPAGTRDIAQPADTPLLTAPAPTAGRNQAVGAPPPPVRTPSLRRRLLLGLALPLLVLFTASAAWDLRVARRLTDDAYDQALASTAVGLAVRLETDADNDLAEHLDATMHAMARLDAPDAWHYLVLDAHGRRLAGEAGLERLLAAPPPNEPAFSQAVIGGEPMRVVNYRYEDGEGDVSVIVAVGLHRRDAATAGIVGATLWPNALLTLAALLVVLAVGRIVFRPLDALGARLAGSRVQDLVPVPLQGAPREALPLLAAVNSLMERLRAAARSQQSFLNHTAHQLRTPLAALQAQLEVLQNEPQADPLGERLAQLLATARRLGHMTHQMLTLARAEPGAAVVVHAPVDLVGLLEEVATQGDVAAQLKGVELEFDPEPATVSGAAWMLQELLSNLLDNAIRHAPAGSIVTIRCGTQADGAAWLEVADAGPGIPAAERDRVFLPFVQLGAGAGGSAGLGLAIVREVAERHGAAVTLGPGPDGRGTAARVVFPCPPRAA